MHDTDPAKRRAVDRRTFLKGGLGAAGVLAAGLTIRALADDDERTANPAAVAPAPATRRRPGVGKPNILVIVVDQMRFPQWPAASPVGPALPANLQRLRSGAVSFARHYTASNDCSPARATLLTGLYTHQTGCMVTGGSTLDPGFPTWGTMLREHGYSTRWLGKWHLTHHDNRWTRLSGETALERYGFAGGVFPSPDGAPGQGWRVDGTVADRFDSWFKAEGQGGPWCTTVSFVNPHDIAWWYAWTDRVARRARRAPHRAPPAAELRDTRAPDRTGKAAPSALLPGDHGGIVRAGPVQRSRVRSAMAGTAGPLRQAPARGRRAHRARARDARKRA